MPIVSNISIIHIVIITIITVKIEPSGKPSVNTLVNEKNTLFSPPKKLAKFSQNFQETLPSPARTERLVTPRGIPTIVAPIIPKITEPLTLSLSSIAIRNKPIRQTSADLAANAGGLPTFTICSPHFVKSTKPTCV